MNVANAADNDPANVGTFRRLSAAFEAMEAAEREAKDNSSDEDFDNGNEADNNDAEDDDQIELGEEGKVPNF